MRLTNMSPLLRPLRWMLPIAAVVLTGCAVVPAEPAYPGPVVYGGTVAPAPVVVASPYPYYYAPPPMFWGPPAPLYVRPPLYYGGGPPYVARPRGHYVRPGARPAGNGSIGSAIRGARKGTQ